MNTAITEIIGFCWQLHNHISITWCQNKERSEDINIAVVYSVRSKTKQKQKSPSIYFFISYVGSGNFGSCPRRDKKPACPLCLTEGVSFLEQSPENETKKVFQRNDSRRSRAHWGKPDYI